MLKQVVGENRQILKSLAFYLATAVVIKVFSAHMLGNWWFLRHAGSNPVASEPPVFGVFDPDSGDRFDLDAIGSAWLACLAVAVCLGLVIGV